MENNNATDSQGNEYFIERVVYNPDKTTALINYRVKENTQTIYNQKSCDKMDLK
jgi:uncharacterized protein YlzI (FlbEa/FlbD family)